MSAERVAVRWDMPGNTAFKKGGTRVKYAVVYCTKTGNTGLLAAQAQKTLAEVKRECIYMGAPSDVALAADTILFGFWTDKGTCPADAEAFLKKCGNKKLFLFGTAGLGGEPAYFDRVLCAVKKGVPTDAHVIGSFMCQGKMPAAVRTRYEAAAKLEPEKMRPMLENFEKALAHPDAADLSALRHAITMAVSEPL